jgi:hypothetical protein
MHKKTASCAEENASQKILFRIKYIQEIEKHFTKR